MGLIDTGRSRVAYELDGPPAAPVLVLSGSLGRSMSVWDEALPALVARHRVLRYDYPGHGASPPADAPVDVADLGVDLLALLDALGIEEASLCGLSLGGMVAISVAAAAPERVERLALVATGPVLGTPASWSERAATVRRLGTGALVDTLLGRWFSAVSLAARPELGDKAAADIRACDDESYALLCEAIGGADLTPQLAAIVAPTLVIGGADDPAAPPPVAGALAGAIAGSSLVVMAAASHLLPAEQPERFSGALVDHLLGPPSARGLAARRAVLGDDHVERALAAATPVTAPFQSFLARLVWDEVWSRPGLERRVRSCMTMAMMVALGRFDELALHIRAARRVGVSPAEITEVLLHATAYCGAPAGNSAFAVAARVLAEEPAAGEDGG